MPEGPEVATMGVSLHAYLQGACLTHLVINSASRYFNALKSTPPGSCLLPFYYRPHSQAYVVLIDRHIEKIDTRGKLIIFFFADLILTCAPAMTGRWSRRPEPHAGVEVCIHQKSSVYYVDQRHMGRLCLRPRVTGLSEVMKNIGPDFLRDEVTWPMFYQAYTQPRNRHKKLATLLMDQKIFSGVGNYLKSDILFLSKLSPHRTPGEMSPAELAELFNTILDVIKESFALGGYTMRDYFDLNDTVGRYQVKIYGMKSPDIVFEKIDHRGTYWRPSCQH